MPRYPRVEDDDYDWPQYVSVGERRRKAEREAARLGEASPVVLKGSRIANTFWGKAWCENLERYSDYANRLPRGRTYVRSGCVVDLKIGSGTVKALVSGSRVYDVEVKVSPIPNVRWKRLCQEKTGMFPLPTEMKFSCSCPDSARMCKHIAAVLYGIGARLDEKPQLLFTLRNVDQQDLITKAGSRLTKPKTARLLETDSLSDLFGIDIAEPKRRRKPRRRTRKGS